MMEKSLNQENSSKYPIYYKRSSQNKVVKRISDEVIFFVQVLGLTNEDFRHSRQRQTFVTRLQLDEFLKDYHVCSEGDYLDMMKDYFAIDKKVREKFIEAYSL